MATYRYQVVCVGLWRGKIKRWNTTFTYSTSSATTALHDKMQACCYPNPGDAVGACSGGVASISVYNSAGGPPINVTTYFDWQSPAKWIPYTGTAWVGVPEGTPVDASGESAALIVGHMAGLSASGKPVTTRKYLHAIPSRTASSYDAPDISAAAQSALAAQLTAPYMRNPAGVAPATVTCEPFYFNHQRVRGRRRTRAQVASQSFSAGVIVGAQPPASGDGPFR